MILEPPSGHSRSLFVYGTLLFDELIMALTDKRFRSAPAQLMGYSRHRVIRDGQETAYPAIRLNPLNSVCGKLLFDVDKLSMKRIHVFESEPPDYDQIKVEVTLDGGRIAPAVAYVAKPSVVPLLAGNWSEEQFARDHLNAYLSELKSEPRRHAE